MPDYKGSQKAEDGVIYKSASSDKFYYTKETTRGVDVDKTDQYLDTIANQPSKSCLDGGQTFIDSISWEKTQQGGYETFTLVRGIKLKSCDDCVVEKESGYNASISLQQVALIEHPKFRWILKNCTLYPTKYFKVNCIKYIDGSEVDCSFWASSGSEGHSIIKLIQDYISYQRDFDMCAQLPSCCYPCGNFEYLYINQIKDSLSKKKVNGVSALDFANRIMAGVQYYYAPQATITTNKTIKRKNEFSPGSNIGKRDSAKGKFSSWNNDWDFLSSGYSIQYDAIQKTGTIQETLIGLPKGDGGGWDCLLYS